MPGYRKTTVGSLIGAGKEREDEARAILWRAFSDRSNGCSQVAVARSLGVAESTLIRWVSRLGLGKALRALRRQARREKWLAPTGRPRRIAGKAAAWAQPGLHHVSPWESPGEKKKQKELATLLAIARFISPGARCPRSRRNRRWLRR